MRTSLSIHTYLVLLVVSTALPMLLFSGLLVDRSASDEQELIARTVRNDASGAANDLNRQIKALQSLSLALAGSRLLQTGDLAGFHDQAAGSVRGENLTAVLYDPAGQQLLSTADSFGPIPPSDQRPISRAIETSRVGVSNLTSDARTGSHDLTISSPVTINGTISYVLSLQIFNSIAAVVAEQVLPPEETIGLVDRDGTVIYRSRNPERVIGLKASADFLNQIQGRDEGWFNSQARDGTLIYVAFSRVKQAGWLVAVSIPRDVLFAPVRQSFIRLLAIGGGTLLLAGVVALTIGRAISRPVTGLSRFAVALAAGDQRVLPPATGIREVDAVSTSMRAEAATLRQQTEQRLKDAETLRSEVEKRQRVERQLIQAQKMEAVGQLTGGLAHDFNNLLAIAIGNLDMLRELSSNNHEVDDLARGALDAMLRGGDLISLMLAFARRQTLAPVQCDVNEIIDVIVELLRRTLGESIVIDLHLATDLWPVLIDRVQFETAIANLATNARDAMPDGGRLTISTSNTHLDEDYASMHPDVMAGDYVLVEVHDTGTGMPPEVLEHVFEPFFTTKEAGLGTGLGLSMVFGFLKQSDGHISVYSEVGEGTAFRLYLPPGQEARISVEAAPLPQPELGGKETILVVEDSGGLRQVLCRQLSNVGYRVLEAPDPRTALEKISSTEEIDLLLTDIVMPGGMNGYALVRAALELRPGLKTLLTTGFSGVTNAGAANARILRKPYRKDELLRLVNETLDHDTER